MPASPSSTARPAASPLSIKALEMAEEKEAIAQFGSADSGASLGDILGAALKKARTRQEVTGPATVRPAPSRAMASRSPRESLARVFCCRSPRPRCALPRGRSAQAPALRALGGPGFDAGQVRGRTRSVRASAVPRPITARRAKVRRTVPRCVTVRLFRMPAGPTAAAESDRRMHGCRSDRRPPAPAPQADLLARRRRARPRRRGRRGRATSRRGATGGRSGDGPRSPGSRSTASSPATSAWPT